MKAFVLCGGRGTRLIPYTNTTPKPMLKIEGRPILEYVIANLKRNGIVDIILTVGYLKEQIMEHFGDGSKFGVKITYLIEQEELKTAGSILPGKGLVKEDFLVVMGDSIMGIDIAEMAKKHMHSGAIATLALKEQEMYFEYGVVDVEAGCVNHFREKPKIEYLANAGMYMFRHRAFEFIEKVGGGRACDFAHDVFPALLKQGERICACQFKGYWVDIGRIADYEKYRKKGVLNGIMGKDFQE